MINFYKSLVFFLKKWKNYIIINLFVAWIIYFKLISQTLYNQFDGIWHGNYRVAGNWEMSLGRWMWGHIDKFQFGIHCEPINSLVALLSIIIGIVLILELFEIKSKPVSYFISILFISNVFICNILSYRFQAIIFGIAFLLSILAAYVIIKMRSNFGGIICGGILIAFSMGCYQAYLGCTASVLLMYMLVDIYKHNNSLSKTIRYCIRAILAVIVGGLLYKLILEIHLNIFDIKLASYNSASSINIIQICKHLIGSIKNTYSVFYDYFFNYFIKHNVFIMNQWLYKIIFIVLLLEIGLMMIKVIKENIWNAMLFLIGILLFPCACSFVLIIAFNSDMGIQMSAPLALFLPLTLCLLYHGTSKINHISFKIYIVILCVMLYGNIVMTRIDQTAMEEGKIATVTLTQNILSTLESRNLLSKDMTYAFVGVPAGNELFYHTELFNQANEYANFGDWWREASCNMMTWDGVLKNYCGVKLNICPVYKYNEIVNSGILKQLPSYPAENAILIDDNICIVKVSEEYLQTK